MSSHSRDQAESRYASPLHRKLQQFVKLDAEDVRLIDEIVSQPREVAARTLLGQEGASKKECYIILEGWGFCYKELEDGGRQIINFQLAGDLMGIRNRLFRVSDHSYATITKATLVTLSFERFQDIVEDAPRLGQAFMWCTARDEAIITEHLVNVGRRSATVRLAHFLCELADRMEFAGLCDDGELSCPLTQEHLGDALGLTSIHVNRILRWLRERQLVSLSGGQLRIHDVAGLEAVASYDDEYLNQHE
jgi:CRP-like cAMP-binding protein